MTYDPEFPDAKLTDVRPIIVADDGASDSLPSLRVNRDRLTSVE
jgi:hypothetical protein